MPMAPFSPTATSMATETLTSWPAIKVLSEDDIPPNISMDVSARDKEKFHVELIICFGVLILGIVGVWVCSLCACWWRGDCFWNGIAEDCRARRRKAIRQKKHSGETSTPEQDKRWPYQEMIAYTQGAHMA